MKTLNTLWILLAGFMLCACSDSAEFPDPKFDSTATRVIEVRRDTADMCYLTCRMEVMNGINTVEVLDGYDYTLIDNLEQYHGVQNLDFIYPIDISDIVRDTSMAYIVKVYDLKNRTYNKAFMVNVKKFSVPEINLISSERTSVLLAAAPLQAKISTGMIPIRNVVVTMDGREIFRYEPEEEVSEYYLDYIIEGLDELKQYNVQVRLEDMEGHSITREVYIFRVDKIEKPIKVICGGYYHTEILLNYDAKERLVSMDMVGECRTDFKYDEWFSGLLEKIEQTNYGSFKDFITYKFDHHMSRKFLQGATETWGHGGMQSQTTVSNVRTYSWDDVRINYFVSGAVAIENVAWADAFGEHIFAEEWRTALSATRNSVRTRMVDFKPIVIPTYIPELPSPLVYINRFPELFHDLFFTKYVHMSSVSYTNPDVVRFTYTYSMDEKGRLSEWRRLYPSINPLIPERSDYYKFIYEDTEDE